MDLTGANFQIQVPVADISLVSAQGAGGLPVVPDGFLHESEKMVPAIPDLSVPLAEEMVVVATQTLVAPILPPDNVTADLIAGVGIDSAAVRKVSSPHGDGDTLM
jgi:hypothetical protein